MNNKDTEIIMTEISKDLYKTFKESFMGKPNDVENRELLKNSLNEVIMQHLMGRGICVSPVDIVVDGYKSELIISFINKGTGEVLENIDELEKMLAWL